MYTGGGNDPTLTDEVSRLKRYRDMKSTTKRLLGASVRPTGIAGHSRVRPYDESNNVYYYDQDTKYNRERMWRKGAERERQKR